MIHVTQKPLWCTGHDEIIKPGEYYSREKDGSVLCMQCAEHYSAIANMPEPEQEPAEVYYPTITQTTKQEAMEL